MTRAEWRVLERREQCANSGHEPSLLIKNGNHQVIRAVCDCGEVSYLRDLRNIKT